MNVLLVSQCSKNALAETRRILDQFAERRGDRTWQTPITQAGLDTLRRLLRRTARKNTAVACHWIRGRDHSELMWIVGDAKRFNAQGSVPTNTTSRDVLRRHDEDDWRTGEDIRLLCGLAALMHDLGKACDAFQRRLEGKLEGRNLYRHEWISLRLFTAFVGTDDDEAWLSRLENPSDQDDEAWLSRLTRDEPSAPATSPFSRLSPIAAAIGWLIVTHHRLPLMPVQRDEGGPPVLWGTGRPTVQAEQLNKLPALITSAWNEVCDSDEPSRLNPYWSFKHGLPVTTPKWRSRASVLAQRLRQRMSSLDQRLLDDPYILHVARLSLMLADHYYSRLESPQHRVHGEPGFPLYANTVRKTGELNQPLDEHLLGVEKHSAAIVRALPSMNQNLPRLARHKGFRKRSALARFRWQDKAFDLARAVRESSAQQGFFGVNMASTGYGKTLANGRILYALADPNKGARFSIALGLRALTLQTGKAYRERLGLGEDELAIRVGGSANRALFEYYEQEAERQGSASGQQLIEEDGHVTYEGNFNDHPLLRRLSDEPGAKALIAAPILICTVDHLVPATESVRGGRQIVPMLRLMSADLVLDEIDDFDIKDLPALTRLVHCAGLLGSRVLLSSATLPPSLVEGLFEAYRAGRVHYQNNRGEPGRLANICCAWFDEDDCQHVDCSDPASFTGAHNRFAGRRTRRLSSAEIRRRARIAPVDGLGRGRDVVRPGLAERLRDHAVALHARNHSIDPTSGKRVSFGLVRISNIEPLFDIALALFRLGAPEGLHIHLCVYHSQHPLLIRSEIERQLDRALDRRRADMVFDLPDIRRSLDSVPEIDQLFIVLGSPVTEIGRDHDYDWSIVEPSSMRSIIQLAGRVRRHRDGACTSPNIILLDANVRYLEDPGTASFIRPGYESDGEWRLDSHWLHALLTPDESTNIDARPRIVERETLSPQTSLVDLEHARLRDVMVAPAVKTLSQRERRAMREPSAPSLGAYTWYMSPRVHLTGVMPQVQPFRGRNEKNVDLVLLPDESGEDWVLHRVHDERKHQNRLYVPVGKHSLRRVGVEAQTGPHIGTWGVVDYSRLLASVANDMDLSLEEAAKRFGCVTVPSNANGWRYHAVLGFSK